jgi:transposase
MNPYSNDLRERIIQAYDRKIVTQKEVAERFGVSVPWVKKLLRHYRETGSVAPRPYKRGRKPVFEGEKLEELKNQVRKDPGATLQELLERSGANGSIMAVFRALKRLGCRRKKSQFGRQNKIVRT